MQIRINQVTMQDKGKYSQLAVRFNKDDGSEAEKVVMSFTHPQVFKTLLSAAPGEHFNIKAERNPKNTKWWDWVNAEKIDGFTGTSTPSSNTRVGNSTGYRLDPERETREERQMRQLYIIRQSSVSTAASSAIFKDEDTILKFAKRIEKYVLGIEDDGSEIK